MVSQGTLVDPTIVAAPSSTKNRAGKRDREMHQTRKGNKSFFGMKAHNNDDADTNLVHSVAVTPANVHYLAVARPLLHGDEVVVDADPGTGASPDGATPPAVAWMVAMPPGRRQLLAPGSVRAVAERATASVREKVEHPFRVIKR